MPKISKEQMIGGCFACSRDVVRKTHRLPFIALITQHRSKLARGRGLSPRSVELSITIAFSELTAPHVVSVNLPHARRYACSAPLKISNELRVLFVYYFRTQENSFACFCSRHFTPKVNLILSLQATRGTLPSATNE
jgi:hypothetical protein